MFDRIVLAWVGFIFFAAVFFVCISILQLIQEKKIAFDKGFLFCFSACLVSFLLCLSVWPPFHHVYEDEFSFISQSVNILSYGKASIITKGSLSHPEAFISWTANPKLPGYAWLEAVLLFFTRDIYHSYFILNIVLGVLLTGIAYRIAWVLTASRLAAWWSAVFLAAMPVRITYSMSAASDISGAFFFFLFLLFICEFRGLNSRRILYAAIFCGIYSICIKPFYGIFVIGGMAIALPFYKREGLLDKKVFSQALLDTFCLLLPVLFAFPVFFFSDLKAGGYSISFILKNILTSIAYLFDLKQNTVLTSIAALFAVLFNILYKKDKLMTVLAVWFFSGFLLISVFFAGGFSTTSQAYSDRYFLFFAFPLVLLAGKGMLEASTRVKSRYTAGLLFIILIGNAYYAAHHYVHRAKFHGFYMKAILLEKMAHLIPDQAYLIDECAAFVAVKTPLKSIQTTLFLNGDHPKEVVFLNGLPDFSYPYRTAMAENILKKEYRCQPLTAVPLKEGDLSATPMLCGRK